jgi:GTP-binding protein LepA
MGLSRLSRSLACIRKLGGNRLFCVTSSVVPSEYASSIRNISICAHVDAGKSTLSDALLRITGAVSEAQIAATPQFLDALSVERERGITVQLRAARMHWRDHVVNIVDTPGHCDFAAQVGQSLDAVDGVLLLLDATKGVQAQTLANIELALEKSKTILPVINKCDLETADVDACLEQLMDLFPGYVDPILTSAKAGTGVEDVLNAVLLRIPPASQFGSSELPLQARIFDSFYCRYRGVVLLCRLQNGSIRPGDSLRALPGDDKKSFIVESVGFLAPHEVEAKELRAGDVGYISAGIKVLGDAPVGSTLVGAVPGSSTEVLPGYLDRKPVVFKGLFPTDPVDFTALRGALQKLKLTDASLTFDIDKSAAMGTGFRVGFSGLLHADVVQQRLEDDFDLDLVASAPSVSYLCRRENENEWSLMSNPADIPEGAKIKEPLAHLDILCREEDVGAMIQLAESRRGELNDQSYVGANRVRLAYTLPLIEVVADFYDSVKQRSSGYATMDFRIGEHRENALARMDISIAGEKLDGLSIVVDRANAYDRAASLVRKLKEQIPRHNFKVSIQATLGGKVIASEHIAPYRKDVFVFLFAVLLL